MVVETHWGAYDLEPGVIDEDARNAFSRGQCHALALALHEETGWEMQMGYWMDPAFGYEEPLDPFGEMADHVAVRSPDGRIVDIFGWHSDDEHPMGDIVFERVDDEIVRQLSQVVHGWLEPQIEDARQFVEAVLALDEVAA